MVQLQASSLAMVRTEKRQGEALLNTQSLRCCLDVSAKASKIWFQFAENLHMWIIAVLFWVDTQRVVFRNFLIVFCPSKLMLAFFLPYEGLFSLWWFLIIIFPVALLCCLLVPFCSPYFWLPLDLSRLNSADGNECYQGNGIRQTSTPY
jgi:hypothetical protein